MRADEARGLIDRVREVLEGKCRYKGIAVPIFEHVQRYRTELESDWAAMLAHQLPALPPFESFWRQLRDFFAWLDGSLEVVEPRRHEFDVGSELIEAAAGGLRAAGMGSASRPLEIVRFAAANHLCVDLDYKDQDGHRATRRIEPYSLRRTSTGNIVLHSERSDGRGHRMYRVDHILDARVADQSFSPRFRVELTPHGAQWIPTEGRRTPSIRVRPAHPGSSTASSGSTYIYECTNCGKLFRRKKQTSRLNPHKDQSGNPCPGRAARFIEIR